MIHRCDFRHNSVHLEGGAISAVDMPDMLISLSHFHNNAAGSGGAVATTECGVMKISGGLMASNTATTSLGGAAQLLDSNVVMNNVSFFDNNASDSGGGVFSSGGELNITYSLFQGNKALRGSGSALWVAVQNVAIVVIVRNSSFINNSALSGGGAIYWDMPGQNEPILLMINNFVNNTALYGDDVATGVRLLSLGEKTAYNITQYSLFAPPVYVAALDFYHQIVKTESSAYMVASLLYEAMCYQTYGSVAGGTVQQMKRGVSNFTSLLVYCDPGYSMTVNITYTVDGNSLSANVPMNFRACVRGEYYGDHVCSPCEAGTYSLTDPSSVLLAELTQIKVCKKCPDSADTCSSDVIVVKEGYWRLSEESSTIWSCPMGTKSCKGGNETGDASCYDGYQGPLCAVCAEGFTFQSSTQQCEPCTNSSQIDVYTSVFILICLLVVGIVGYYIHQIKVLGRKIKETGDAILFICLKFGLLTASDHSTSSYDTLKTQARILARRLTTRMQIYVNLWLIGSILPLALDLQFPNIYSLIITIFRVFDLSISKSSLISCSSEGYDAIDALVIDTTSPLIIVTVLWIASAIHIAVASSHRDDTREKTIRSLQSRYFTAFKIYTFLILPERSTQIFSIFSCKDVDPDGLNEGDDSYMVADYSVSCSSTKYHFGRSWAIAMIFVYPIGIPLFFFFLLYRSRLDIQSRNDPSLSIEKFALLSQRTSPIRSLFESYKPHFWYWEVVETIRRLMLTGVLVLIAQGSAIQIIVGLFFSIVGMLIHNYCEPYQDSNLQLAMHISHWQICGLFFVALVLKADFESIQRSILGVFLILILFYGVANDLCLLIWHYALVSNTLPHDSHRFSLDDPRLSILTKGSSVRPTEVNIRMTQAGSIDLVELQSEQPVEEERGCSSISHASPLHDERL